MVFNDTLVYRRLRAPRHDRGLLLDPRWDECIAQTQETVDTLASCDFDWLGNRFQSLRQRARGMLIREAIAHTRSYLDRQNDWIPEATIPGDLPVIVSGHQPTLFHPGVWAKNFAIDRLARETGGRAIQVVIDNDLLRSHAVMCPAGSWEAPFRINEPFDQYHNAVPYEAGFVQDRELFGSFAERVSERIRPFVARPLIKELWPMVCQGVDTGLPIGQAIARARHQIEADWGLQTLEVPLSRLCESTEFRWFAAYLMLHAEHIQTVYNRRLEEYRELHKIRNHAQPLPNLRKQEDQQQGWFETPLWIWSDEDPTRKAIWVRTAGDQMAIGNGEQEIVCTFASSSSPDKLVDQLGQLHDQGYCIRPKALANTLFLRLFLADFFFHGIGGAKYDQVTDLILGDLFPIHPPHFGVLSLTTWLPSPNLTLGDREIIHKRQQIRDMYFHPERFLEDSPFASDHVSSQEKRKRKLLRCKPARGFALSWHREVEQVNVELRENIERKREIEKKKLADLVSRSRASELFSSREWSFCLFDPSFLRERMLDLDSHRT